MPIRVHDLLLGFAGRLDDDGLADARQMLASAEVDRALEFLVGCLVAGRIAITQSQRAELDVLLGQVYMDVAGATERLVVDDAAAAQVSARHRFGGPAGGEAAGHGVAEAARRVLDVLPDVRSVWAVWRLTPAGAVSGPVPHRVVLVGVGPNGFAPATSYRLEHALRRAGIRASVEVLRDGTEAPDYHHAAMQYATQVPFARQAPTNPAPVRPRAAEPRSVPDPEPPRIRNVPAPDPRVSSEPPRPRVPAADPLNPPEPARPRAAATDPLGPRGATDPLGSRAGADALGPRGAADPLGPRAGADPLGPRAAADPLGPRGATDPLGSRGAADPLGSRSAAGEPSRSAAVQPPPPAVPDIAPPSRRSRPEPPADPLASANPPPRPAEPVATTSWLAELSESTRPKPKVNGHAPSVPGDEALSEQEKQLLRQLQEELARREQEESDQARGRHGNPNTFDWPTSSGSPTVVNGIPPQPPDPRR